MKFKILFSILFLASISHSQTPIQLDSSGKQIDIDRYEMIYSDETNQLTIQDITSDKFSSKFSIPLNPQATLYDPEKTIWLKMIINENHSGSDHWNFVNWFGAGLELIELYKTDSSGKAVKFATGGGQLPFKERELQTSWLSFHLPLDTSRPTTIYAKVKGAGAGFSILTTESFQDALYYLQLTYGIIYGILLALILYNLFLFINLLDTGYLYYVLYLICYLLLIATMYGHGFQFLWPDHTWMSLCALNVFASLSFLFALLFTRQYLLVNQFAPRLKNIYLSLQVYWILNALYFLCYSYYPFKNLGSLQLFLPGIMSLILVLSSGVLIYRKGFKPAKYYLIAWTPLVLLVSVYIFANMNSMPEVSFTLFHDKVHISAIAAAPVLEALLLSLALAYRINLLRQQVADEKLNLERVERDKEIEKREIIEKQKEDLEIKVDERTRDLSQSLKQLKETQLQLVQSEKMASLGQLTAGIAHEIQNPLNFVNNFSELSHDLIDEIENSKSNEEQQQAISDLKNYLNKINHHGKRADAIIKSMLEHSRSGKGELKLTDINQLCDEFLNLSYHGIRSKNSGFNCVIERNYGKDLPKVNLFPQDISRVFLNIFNNAFYAMNAKRLELNTDKPQNNDEYLAILQVTTIKRLNNIAILICDNGGGIKDTILEKIFEPFFTTKPTGQGTGLGLSLSYEIIKAHGGDIKVESEVGKGTEFRITLPI